MTSAVVLAGGDLPDVRVVQSVAAAARIVAADSGVAIARQNGLAVDMVVCDLDSISDEDRSWIEDAGVEVRAFSADKDETDLELALDTACDDAGVERVFVLGAEGGRVDHQLAIVSVCCRPRRCRVIVLGDRSTIHILHGGTPHDAVTLVAEPGDLVSLIPQGGSAVDVQTRGLRWELTGETLQPFAGRGVSNRLVGEVAEVAVGEGTLLVVHNRPRRA